ncbi:hypothetical protein ACLB2K_021760 [Fragaria x ananassa]
MPISLRLRKLTEKGDVGGQVEDGEVEDAPASPIPQLKSQTHQSPSSSKKKAPSSSLSSKADELKELAKQLLQQTASLSTDDEEEHSPSESSSAPSQQSSPSYPTRWADYEDSQDPYAEFLESSPTQKQVQAYLKVPVKIST